MTDIKTMIEVMQAHADGLPIEVRGSPISPSHWYPTKNPVWDWSAYEYRVALVPDEVNWDHVSPDGNAIQRDSDGRAMVYGDIPEYVEEGDYFDGDIKGDATVLASYKPGTLPWDKSLIVRPGYEEKK